MSENLINKVAQFYKVSFDEYQKTFCEKVKDADKYSLDDIRTIYDAIILPSRATVGSAGYDFRSPFDFRLSPGEEIVVPFGIRVKMQHGWVLALFPRSGLGSKYRFQLNNTVGIIDADYFEALNEGHLMSTLSNCSYDNKTLDVKAGDGILQGVFLPFGITYDDDEQPKSMRSGGFGSTDNKDAKQS